MIGGTKFPTGVVIPTVRSFRRSMPWPATSTWAISRSTPLPPIFKPYLVQHGEVKKAQVITDRETGRSRGFGFVEMATSEAAEAAISSLNGREVDGRALTVNLAKERAR